MCIFHILEHVNSNKLIFIVPAGMYPTDGRHAQNKRLSTGPEVNNKYTRRRSLGLCSTYVDAEREREMPFHLVKGRYHVANYAPDGDTVRFQPDNPASLDRLDGPPAKLNARGHAAIRLEGIDTLETHYQGLKQPPPLADEATDRLFELLGITNVEWAEERRSIKRADDATPGYILSRSVEKYGRIVALAFAGEADEPDGSPIFLDGKRLAQSVNVAQARSGMAYPTFYWGLFADLRQVFIDAAATARASNSGVYAVDRSTTGFLPASVAALTDEHVILPKLFRRLAVYMLETGSSIGFKARLEASEEPVLDLLTQNITHFDTFIEETAGGAIKLLRRPEEMVFDPMPQRIATDFNALMAAATAPLAPIMSNKVAMSPDPEVFSFERRVAKIRNLTV